MNTKRITKEGWLFIAAYAFAGAMFVWSGWQGEKWVIVALAIFLIVTQVLYQFTRALLDDVLETSSTALDGWKKESEYASAITNDNVAMITLLLEHEPRKAQYYQERLSKAVANRYPSALAEHQSKAKMN